MTIRPVTTGDLGLICRHRHQMLSEAGRGETALTATNGPFRRWLARRLKDGSYFGFIAEETGQPIGGIVLMGIDWPPHPSRPANSRRGYVLNLFVDTGHRRRGVARALMNEAERELAKRRLMWLILHATAAGKPLFTRIGRTPASDMRKR